MVWSSSAPCAHVMFVGFFRSCSTAFRMIKPKKTRTWRTLVDRFQTERILARRSHGRNNHWNCMASVNQNFETSRRWAPRLFPEYKAAKCTCVSPTIFEKQSAKFACLRNTSSSTCSIVERDCVMPAGHVLCSLESKTKNEPKQWHLCYQTT